MPAPTWSEQLAAFVARWYESPLADEDGHTDDEIDDVVADLGQPMPGVLRTWYRLLGARLEAVQDTPVLLDDLVAERRGPNLPVWIENQQVWRLCAPPGAADDPPAILEPADERWPGGPLSQVLLAMLVSETLMAFERGPLGPLGRDVVTGYLQDSHAQDDARVRAALSPIALPPNPFFTEPNLGDDDLVMRFDGVGWQWMARGDDAVRRAIELLELDQIDTHELVIQLDRLEPAEQSALHPTDHDREIDRLNALAGATGIITQAGFSGDGASFHFATVTPDALLARVRHAFPAAFDDRLVITVRREGIHRRRVVYPDRPE